LELNVEQSTRVNNDAASLGDIQKADKVLSKPIGGFDHGSKHVRR